MSIQENPLSNVANGEPEDEQRVIDTIINATPPPRTTARIHRVPRMVRESEDYTKYYVPKVVSIGPYHFGNPKLESVEKLKPFLAKKLVSDKETVRNLYKKLGEPGMVKELREFYEENSTNKYCNKVFTKMMLFDCCFILYYIMFILSGQEEKNREYLKSHQIVFVHQDLFLLENQIPFKALGVAMEVMNIDCLNRIKPFIYGNILSSGVRKRRWFRIRTAKNCRDELIRELIEAEPDHLLHLLHRSITKKVEVPKKDASSGNDDRCTFRNVNELVDVGIRFKPSDTMSLAHIEFFRGNWWFSATVKIAPITVDDSTKPVLLNLMAYEVCAQYDAPVTSFICLLDSLIDHPEDVKTLRKAGVLENSLGSDKEVAKLFNEIGTDLVSDNSEIYLEAKNRIQRHYDSWRNTVISELKHEYVKSPWAFIALLGALLVLFLTAVQAYFTVWSPKGTCDDLCLFLKKNHHL